MKFCVVGFTFLCNRVYANFPITFTREELLMWLMYSDCTNVHTGIKFEETHRPI